MVHVAAYTPAPIGKTPWRRLIGGIWNNVSLQDSWLEPTASRIEFGVGPARNGGHSLVVGTYSHEPCVRHADSTTPAPTSCGVVLAVNELSIGSMHSD